MIHQKLKKKIATELNYISGATFVDAKFIGNSSKEAKIYTGDSCITENDIGMLIRWKAKDNHIFTYSIFKLDYKKTEIDTQKFVLKSQILIKSDYIDDVIHEQAPKGSLEETLNEIKRYNNVY